MDDRGHACHEDATSDLVTRRDPKLSAVRLHWAKVSSGLEQDRLAWSVSIRDVATSIGDAG